jgi:glycosyltransferase involved in cell wall biosynthesis
VKNNLAHYIIWVFPGELDRVLHSATWLETTRELRAQKWRVALVVSGGTDQKRIRGVEVTSIPRPDIYLIRQIAFHIRFIRLVFRQWGEVDAVIAPEISGIWLLPLWLRRWITRRRRPYLLIDIRSMQMPSADHATVKDALRIGYLKAMAAITATWVDGYLTITQRMADAMRIPARRLWGVWPSGVIVEEFSRASGIRRWPASGERVELIYTGSLHYERNLMAFCLAVLHANAQGMAFRFTMLGDGSQRRELETLASSTDGVIRVLPPVPYDEVPNILAQAHVGVLPFPDEEKFRVSSPIKLFEYLASGMPVLATRIACHTDVLGEKTCVFWAERSDEAGLHDALQTVWRRRGSLPVEGALAIRASADWTWHESAGKIIQALKKGFSR